MKVEFTEKYEGVEDRDGWGPGPWDGEPDKVVWVDETTGLDCMARRGGGGSWCGYVGVKQEHPWHGLNYSNRWPDAAEDQPDPESLIEVHGGLTFSGACHDEGDPSSDICHVSDEPVWWFGFDCSHAGDQRPRENAYRTKYPDWPEMPFGYETYKTLGYVVEQTTWLAEQVADA